MDQDTLKKIVRRVSSSDPNILLFPLIGQPPGECLSEHNDRIHTTIDVAYACSTIGCRYGILAAGGVPDRDGITGGRYTEGQIIALSRARGRHRPSLAEKIVPGERVSCHTAENIRLSRQFITRGRYDMVILISNWLHLRRAGVYFSYFMPGVTCVLCSSGSGRGTLGMPYSRYVAYEIALFAFALEVDCCWPNYGRFFDDRAARRAEEQRNLRYPPVPYVSNS